MMVKTKKEKTARVQLQNLLVPVDFSPAALGAVRYAAGLAEQHRSKIVLLHVTTVGEPEQAIARAKKKLARLCQAEGMVADRCRLLVRVGVPFFEITQAASATATDLIILGRSMLPATAAGGDGHTLERVVRYARCPVLLVGEESADPARNRRVV
ncbi:MAG: universal stress protein [Chthoniobacterales bacterium]